MPDDSISDRFTDEGTTIYSLMAGEVLVECPSCGCCAIHRPIVVSERTPDWFTPRRLTCSSCGLVRDWNETGIQRGWHESPARDDFFHAVLWIRGRCLGHELWAYNWDHLNLLERYVSAAHRTHVHSATTGWGNGSVVNRLPRWMTSSSNRETVLKAISKIRQDRCP